MGKKIILKRFTLFLKKNNVYDLYLNNLIASKGRKESIDFIINCLKREPADLILGAFPWYSSSTQQKSWGQLYGEWCAILMDENLI